MDYDEKKDYDATNVTVVAARNDDDGAFSSIALACSQTDQS